MTDFQQLPTLYLGPMSANVIDAAVAFSQAKSWPICLIASRRQIDSQLLGGGYVDDLTTEHFAARLHKAVKSGQVILARDHGGPYQRGDEAGLSFDEAMRRAELSYGADIQNGFSIIHIDPEKCVKEGDPDGLDRFTELTQECLARCFAMLDKTGRDDVRFEVGSDEGIGMEFVPDQWAQFLAHIDEFCAARGRPAPLAIAVPLGTKVKETENIGGLALNAQDPFWLKRIQAMQDIARRFGVKLKLHNADYIAPNVLRSFLTLGVGQINVAPELGVLETRALLRFLLEHDMETEAENFVKIAYDSGKWERWLKPGSPASYEDKAVIAGHYIFAAPECRELFKEIQAHPHAERLQPALLAAITEGIEKYYLILEEMYASLQSISS